VTEKDELWDWAERAQSIAQKLDELAGEFRMLAQSIERVIQLTDDGSD
jgi:hypothetical protein